MFQFIKNLFSPPQAPKPPFQEHRADYAAARITRFNRQRKGLPGMGAGADYHYKSDADYLRMMEIARDMDRNDVVIGALMKRACTNILQNGIPRDIDTGDTEFDNDLRQGWDHYALSKSCTLDESCNYTELEFLSLRSMLVAGGHYNILTELNGWPCIQPMEAHRLRTPHGTRANVKLGILKDSHGRPIEYWFTKNDVDGLTPIKNANEVVPVRAYDEAGHPIVLPVVERTRTSQSVGITALAPIIDTAGQFEDLQFFNLVKAQIAACLTFKRKRTPEFTANNATPAQTGERDQILLPDGTTRLIDGLAPGMEMILGVGEDIEAMPPGVVSSEYFQQVHLALQLISINLGVPLCILMLDGSETNFSGWRGAVDQARMGWRRNQRLMIDAFHRPIWNWWVLHFLSSNADVYGALKRRNVEITPDAWVSFNPAGYPYIQPLDDAKACALRVEKHQNSLRREHALVGSDWDKVSQEIVDDRGDLVVKALDRARVINGKYPEAKLNWRELAGVPVKPLSGDAEKPDESKTDDEKPAKPAGGGKAA